MYFDSMTNDERHALAMEYRERFQSLKESARMIESREALARYRFIPGAILLNAREFPAFEDVRDRLQVPADIAGKRVLLSHRWLSDRHPDPHGHHFQIARAHIEAETHYWFDYSCLPQGLSEASIAARQPALDTLPSLMYGTGILVVRSNDDQYFERAWCIFEYVAGYVLG